MDHLASRAEALRAFSRFYTRHIGALGEGLLDSRFSLAESRVLWELAHAPGRTASRLAVDLQLDAGYMSRLLAGLRERGLLKVGRAPHDARQTLLSLSAAGKRAFAPLDRRSQHQATELLSALSDAEQQEFVDATRRIRALMGDTLPDAADEITLRKLRPGDLGWVVARHGVLYAQEYGWDQRFESLVARIVADYVDKLQPQRERAWVADRHGVPVGCVFLVQAREESTGKRLRGTAQLRLLLVEPAARGHGLGKRLSAACEDYATACGYSRIRLWTNSVLLAARGIYRAAGYRQVASEAHRCFGQALVGEVWEKDLGKNSRTLKR